MSLQFSNTEFKSMMFNPSKIPEGTSVFKIYPQLGSFKIFKKSPGAKMDNDKVMLFILCMYDRNTPYRTKYTDVLKRKIEVAHDVGFKVDEKGFFETPIEDMLVGKNEIVNAKIVEFIRIHRNSKYAYLVAIEASYYNIMTQIQAGETSLIKEARKIQEEMEDILTEIINDDDNPFTKDTVLRYMEEERLGLSPEEIALKLSEGKPIF